MRSLPLLALVAVAATSACQDQKPSAAAPPAAAAPAARPVVRVSGQEARALVAGGATLLDVRTPGEFEELHIEGAKNIPLQVLGQSLAAVPKDKPVVVYCAVGARAASAAAMLASAGYDVRNLGAMASWNQ